MKNKKKLLAISFVTFSMFLPVQAMRNSFRCGPEVATRRALIGEQAISLAIPRTRDSLDQVSRSLSNADLAGHSSYTKRQKIETSAAPES